MRTINVVVPILFCFFWLSAWTAFASKAKPNPGGSWFASGKNTEESWGTHRGKQVFVATGVLKKAGVQFMTDPKKIELYSLGIIPPAGYHNAVIAKVKSADGKSVTLKLHVQLAEKVQGKAKKSVVVKFEETKAQELQFVQPSAEELAAKKALEEWARSATLKAKMLGARKLAGTDILKNIFFQRQKGIIWNVLSFLNERDVRALFRALRVDPNYRAVIAGLKRDTLIKIAHEDTQRNFADKVDALKSLFVLGMTKEEVLGVLQAKGLSTFSVPQASLADLAAGKPAALKALNAEQRNAATWQIAFIFACTERYARDGLSTVELDFEKPNSMADFLFECIDLTLQGFQVSSESDSFEEQVGNQFNKLFALVSIVMEGGDGIDIYKAHSELLLRYATEMKKIRKSILE